MEIIHSIETKMNHWKGKVNDKTGNEIKTLGKNNHFLFHFNWFCTSIVYKSIYLILRKLFIPNVLTIDIAFFYYPLDRRQKRKKKPTNFEPRRKQENGKCDNNSREKRNKNCVENFV